MQVMLRHLSEVASASMGGDEYFKDIWWDLLDYIMVRETCKLIVWDGTLTPKKREDISTDSVSGTYMYEIAN